jgi:hypothetical protein
MYGHTHCVPGVDGEHQVGWNFAARRVSNVLSVQSFPGASVVALKAVDVENDLHNTCKYEVAYANTQMLLPKLQDCGASDCNIAKVLPYLINRREGCAANDVQGADNLGKGRAAVYECLGGNFLGTLQGFTEGGVATRVQP